MKIETNQKINGSINHNYNDGPQWKTNINNATAMKEETNDDAVDDDDDHDDHDDAARLRKNLISSERASNTRTAKKKKCNTFLCLNRFALAIYWS